MRFALTVTALFIGCSGPGSPDGDGGIRRPDSGSDSGSPDAGHATDAGHDAGHDAGAFDAGIDASLDAGDGDAGDAGPPCGPPGLYVAGSCMLTETGVRAYTPRYAHWSDGAEAERFVFLPLGNLIVTSDPDNWVFPVGTRIYETLSQDGVRLETRLLEKVATGTGPSAWSMRAFAWNAAQDAVADVTNEGLARRANVLGTEHDIPSGDDCQGCHSAALDVLNGFSAIQLNHSGSTVSLQTLIDEGRLSVPIATRDAETPGTGTSAAAALGYLHANCGHCHRTDTADPTSGCPTRFGAASPPTRACATGLHLWLRVSDDVVENAPAFTTAVGQVSLGAAGCRIHPYGDADMSAVPVQMDTRGTILQMPPLGTELIDAAGLATVRTWIESLDVPPPSGAPEWPCIPPP